VGLSRTWTGEGFFKRTSVRVPSFTEQWIPLGIVAALLERDETWTSARSGEKKRSSQEDAAERKKLFRHFRPEEKAEGLNANL